MKTCLMKNLIATLSLTLSLGAYSMGTETLTAKNGMKVTFGDGKVTVSDHGTNLKTLSLSEFQFVREEDQIDSDKAIVVEDYLAADPGGYPSKFDPDEEDEEGNTFFNFNIAADPGGYPSKIDVEEFMKEVLPRRAHVELDKGKLHLAMITVDDITLEF